MRKKIYMIQMNIYSDIVHPSRMIIAFNVADCWKDVYIFTFTIACAMTNANDESQIHALLNKLDFNLFQAIRFFFLLLPFLIRSIHFHFFFSWEINEEREKTRYKKALVSVCNSQNHSALNIINKMPTLILYATEFLLQWRGLILMGIF